MILNAFFCVNILHCKYSSSNIFLKKSGKFGLDLKMEPYINYLDTFLEINPVPLPPSGQLSLKRRENKCVWSKNIIFQIKI